MRQIKEILTIEEHFDELSNRCDEIDVRKDATLMREITKSLKDTMRSKELVSLSAPAIGYDKRIFCLNFEDTEIKTFINPVIVEVKGLDKNINNTSKFELNYIPLDNLKYIT